MLDPADSKKLTIPINSYNVVYLFVLKNKNKLIIDFKPVSVFILFLERSSNNIS